MDKGSLVVYGHITYGRDPVIIALLRSKLGRMKCTVGTPNLHKKTSIARQQTTMYTIDIGDDFIQVLGWSVEDKPIETLIMYMVSAIATVKCTCTCTQYSHYVYIDHTAKVD